MTAKRERARRDPSPVEPDLLTVQTHVELGLEQGCVAEDESVKLDRMRGHIALETQPEQSRNGFRRNECRFLQHQRWRS